MFQNEWCRPSSNLCCHITAPKMSELALPVQGACSITMIVFPLVLYVQLPRFGPETGLFGLCPVVLKNSGSRFGEELSNPGNLLPTF